jgi:penicillin-binding protein 2
MRLAEFKDHQRELYFFQLRIGIAGFFVLAAFSLLLVRLVYLQVVQYDYYRTKAEDNRISIVPIMPNRGLILDRSGTVLARNYSAYTLEISPGNVADLEKTIDELAAIVEIRASDRTRFKRLRIEAKGADSLPIRTRLTDEEVAKFAVNRYRFPGVDIQARLFRQYPLNEMASHLVGYIGRINDRDVEHIEDEGLSANYKGTDHIGKTGLEQSYESELHGITGYEQVEVDSGGRGVRTLSRTSPTSGNNLVLTLDIKLQEVAEQAFGENRGALVAIEPSTGGILAFVSKPGFDPNLFVDGIDPASWEELNTSPDRPMVNRALAGTYPPGSTFKPYMALAALELGKRTQQQTIYDPGFFQFGNHRFRDDKVGGHGTVDMYKSIVASCDTYYYMLGNDLGIETSRVSSASSASARKPASTWKARRRACCPRRSGNTSASGSRSSRNGMPARPSASASARATTPIRRCRWRRRWRRSRTTASCTARTWSTISRTSRAANAPWSSPRSSAP